MKGSQNLCSPQELLQYQNNDAVRVVDGSWYLPAQAVDVKSDYLERHIPGAVFFDIDQVCDQRSELPHMLPSAEQFAEAAGELGISNKHEVIVYDSAGLFSAARVWWMFRVFGHQPVRVLNGGLPAWIDAGGQVTNTDTVIEPATFTACLDRRMLADKADLKANCESPEYRVLDARSEGRFRGSAPEPRAGLPSGHMPQSTSLPYDKLLHQGRLKSAAELRSLFAGVDVNGRTPVITSCGSGVTAAIITLALAEAGYGLQRLYDGAWAEWASAQDTTVLSG